MKTMLGRRSSRAVLVLVLGALAGCGGAKSEPREPEPASSASGPAVAPASSEKVKQGRDLLTARKFEEASQILAEARQDKPNDPQAAYYHGVALEGLGETEAAKAAYERALELDGALLEASQNLSALLLEQDSAEQALAVADAGLKNAPKDPGLLANRALALGALGSDEAERAFETALAARSGDGWLRYYYAGVLTLHEKNDAATAELKKISSDALKDADLLIAVSELYGVLKDFPSCVQLFDRALSEKSSAELLVRRGRCKLGTKDLSGAEADFRRATTESPEDPMGYFYLGKHLVAQGKAAEGKKALTRAVELGPETPFGKQAKAALSGK